MVKRPSCEAATHRSATSNLRNKRSLSSPRPHKHSKDVTIAQGKTTTRVAGRLKRREGEMDSRDLARSCERERGKENDTSCETRRVACSNSCHRMILFMLWLSRDRVGRWCCCCVERCCVGSCLKPFIHSLHPLRCSSSPLTAHH